MRDPSAKKNQASEKMRLQLLLAGELNKKGGAWAVGLPPLVWVGGGPDRARLGWPHRRGLPQPLEGSARLCSAQPATSAPHTSAAFRVLPLTNTLLSSLLL
jgi:hypothetical protein